MTTGPDDQWRVSETSPLVPIGSGDSLRSTPETARARIEISLKLRHHIRLPVLLIISVMFPRNHGSSLMTRHRKSFNERGHAHELTFSCYRGFPFLQVERTCEWLAEAVDNARAEYSFLLWAYVFMPDHVHLVVLPTDDRDSVSTILKAIKAPVGRKAIEFLTANAPQWLPRITRKRGQTTERLFWQSGGGYDRNVILPKTLLKMIDYIHANPVRRGLVGRPREWKWSSAPWYDDLSPVPLTVDPIPVDWLD